MSGSYRYRTRIAWTLLTCIDAASIDVIDGGQSYQTRIALTLIRRVDISHVNTACCIHN
ncbi:hypothetical protein H6F98_07280 [Microcoleus sp. FACHB-SPT15]|uniref:hypothetical protein n=1 Tax=Microcoleus sp. FACHB-SPT15 TaxID=2692830 RepID=UPI0017870508|nr:hypothetical protein [Microcoleus sp. FACHB-SPT15]MBD1805250.1 hypothetical protein [Microcoleus sp. FACHB-SPT15]